MGTNFYAKTADGESIHLGKRSAGWRFGFHATDHFASTRELAGWLENTPVTIKDEYGVEYDPVEWFRMAVEWGKDWGDTPGHRRRNCWCGPDEAIHGVLWPLLDDRSFVDEASDTDWMTGEFF